MGWIGVVDTNNGNDSSLVHSFEFNPSTLSAALQFEAFADKLAFYGDHQPLAQTFSFSDWHQQKWHVGDIVFSKSHIGPFTVLRDKSFTKRTNTEFIGLRMLVDGFQTSLYDDMPAIMKPGEIHLHDNSTCLFGRHEINLQTIAVTIPYSAINFDPSIHQQYINLSKSSPVAATLVKHTLNSIFSNINQLTKEDGVSVSAGFCGLLKGIYFGSARSEEDQRHIEQAKTRVIKSFIDMNLDNPRLNANFIGKQFGLSRASLYRLFAGDGGVKNYISSKKLTRAFQHLSEAPRLRGAVGQIAEKYGYTDQAHFSRVFKNKYDYAPTDLLGIYR